MASVDELIEALQLGREPTAPPGQLAPAHHDFDDSDEEGHGGHQPARCVMSPTPATHLNGKPSPSNAHDFDDDVSDDDSSAALRLMDPVPFPNPLPRTKVLLRCSNSCTVTNLPFSGKSSAYPSLDSLVQLSKGGFGKWISTAGVMQRKGAYHAYLPVVGNGCLNNSGDPSEKGGCPHITCLKCNYVVIRLQGAAWNDEKGQLDFYLTVRNFYPDWSRLAGSTPVGVSGAKERVLIANPDAAAYCCQCSWLTVTAPREVIRTAVVDLIPYKDKGGDCFATHLPCGASETRRHPLWMCSGHLPEE